MIDLGPHAVFIVSAYAGVTLAIAGLIGWTLFDARRTAKKLADLEARGIRRRSAGPA
ncbi:heme exporter protein D [Devosia yakushimensis]|uniref:Heme exporter protein D n=1 Tax=Devosia yakushimensis TaxID=470028 RepID=A0ABQ5UJI7_9HYPH|nr:heme exporter protein CcmD [Devosia yakushimensis]GLQ12203.1 heme exporter protein D [Devosia yakushimensis]